MVWNKGNVEKTLTNSQFFSSNKRSASYQNQHQNQPQLSASKTKIRKITTRSTQNLQSAKSLKSDRSMPKGLKIK